MKTVFLDRDGTINIDSGYLTDPAEVELYQGIPDAIARMKAAGFRIVIVTNQSAIGRGMATVQDVEATNDEVLRQLLDGNSEAKIDLVRYSPAHPDDNDPSRKPGTGMISDLMEEASFDASSCWVVGDKISDLDFGKNVGIPFAQRILLETGDGPGEIGPPSGYAGYHRYLSPISTVLVQRALVDIYLLIISVLGFLDAR